MDTDTDSSKASVLEKYKEQAIRLAQTRNEALIIRFCLETYRDGTSLLDLEKLPTDDAFREYMTRHPLPIPTELTDFFPSSSFQWQAEQPSETQEASVIVPPFNRFGVPSEHLKLLTLRYATPEVLMQPGELGSLRFFINSEPAFLYLPKAPKVISSVDWSLARDEYAVIRTLRRIEEIKLQGAWSLRQIRRQPMPPRRKSHHDYLLEECAWLSTDIHEERRWKMSISRFFAHHIAEYHLSSDKSSFCTRHPWFEATSSSLHHDAITMQSSAAMDVTSALGHSFSTQQQPPLDPNHTGDIINSLIKSKVIYDKSAFTYSSETSYPLQSVLLNPDLACYTALMGNDEIYMDPIETLPLVPVTKWMLRKRPVPNGGRLRRLNGLARYDPNPLLSLLFSSKRPKEMPPTANHKPTAPPNAALKTSPVWTPDEDDMLIQAVRLYIQNWDIIADYVNSGHYLPGLTRSPYDCYTRYSTLEKTGSLNVYASKEMPIKSKKEALQKQKTFRLETRKKMTQHAALFDAIHKCTKARVLRNSLGRKNMPHSHSQPHASHLEAADKVGSGLNWKNATPMEVLARRGVRMKLLMNRNPNDNKDIKPNHPGGAINLNPAH